jgi:hypothetical protein
MPEEIEITTQGERGTILIVGALLALIIGYCSLRLYQFLTKTEKEIVEW